MSPTPTSGNAPTIYIAGKLINLLLAPLAIVLLPGILGANGYGQYSYWFGLISLYLVLFDLGTQPMLRRFLPQLMQDSPQASASLVGYSLLLKLIPLLCLLMALVLNDSPGTSLALIIAALLGSLTTTLSDILYCKEKMIFHHVLVLIRKLLRLALVAALFFGYGLTGVLVALVLTEVIAFAVGLPAIKNLKAGQRISLTQFFGFYKEGSWVFIAMICSMMLGRLPIFSAQWSGMEPSTIGLIALSVDLTYFALKEMLNAVSESLFPRMVVSQTTGLTQQIQQLVTVNYQVLNFISIGVIAVAVGLVEWLPKLLGEECSPAVTSLRLMMVGTLFSCWNLVHNQILLLSRRSYIMALAQFVGLLIAVVTVLTSWSELSETVVIWAIILGMVASCLVSYLGVNYRSKVSVMVFVKTCVAGLLVYGLVSWLSVINLWLALLGGACALVIYPLSVWLLCGCRPLPVLADEMKQIFWRP